MEIDIKEVVDKLLNFRVGFLPSECKKYATKFDEKAPFFSEAYLYNLLGKENARTLLALMHPIWDLAGIKREDQP